MNAANPQGANPQGASPQGVNPQDQNIKVVFQDEVSKVGAYANAVSVHINANEVVLDFGYSVPNTKDPHEIMITSRVNMNHRSAEQFLSVLQNSLLDFRNKLKEAQAQMQAQQANGDANAKAA